MNRPLLMALCLAPGAAAQTPLVFFQTQYPTLPAQEILRALDPPCARAGRQPPANCDRSTASPILNVSDFSCFLNAFASGCP